ncbi:hypothetical protein ACTPOE_16855 [Castellaniella sp. WN]
MTTETVLAPIAWLRGDQLRKLGKPHSDSPLNEKTDLMMLRAAGTAETAKKYGHEVSVITTDQAEACANARVREALEQAAKVAMNAPITADMLDSGDAKAVCFHASTRILMLRR